ncbi:MAG: hypothetical protein H7Y15_01560 [Pseudonocardia sp.]|nr:hypothetical protein [Pseudonocardia sp.]
MTPHLIEAPLQWVRPADPPPFRSPLPERAQEHVRAAAIVVGLMLCTALAASLAPHPDATPIPAVIAP